MCIISPSHTVGLFVRLMFLVYNCNLISNFKAALSHGQLVDYIFTSSAQLCNVNDVIEYVNKVQLSQTCYKFCLKAETFVGPGV